MDSFHSGEKKDWLMSQQPVADSTPDCVSHGPCEASSPSRLCLFDSFVHLRLSSNVNELMRLSLSVSPSALGETVQLRNLTIQMMFHTHTDAHPLPVIALNQLIYQGPGQAYRLNAPKLCLSNPS